MVAQVRYLDILLPRCSARMLQLAIKKELILNLLVGLVYDCVKSRKIGHQNHGLL